MPAIMALFLGLSNLFILGIAAYAAVLNASYPEFAYFTVQEDEFLEWATFWGFAIASVVFFLSANNQHENERRIPWFLVGVGLFCLVVAMEEISWGQRLLGYRPPVYFLEENFQQELNFHNVIATDFRKLALMIIIIGYGVILPIVALVRPVGELLGKIGVVAPSAWLAPSFVLIAGIYQTYPWPFSGEWVEAMLAAGFLATALESSNPTRATLRGCVAVMIVIVLSTGNVWLGRIQSGADIEKVAIAEAELDALQRDFLGGKVKTRCNRHKRLYTFMVEYEQPYLRAGEFAALQQKGMPAERADYLLDPWNSPYWLRDRCTRNGERKRVVYVYSFGPNRRRDSTQFEIGGDDVGAFILDTR